MKFCNVHKSWVELESMIISTTENDKNHVFPLLWMLVCGEYAHVYKWV